MAEIKTEKMATRQAYGKTLVELGKTTPHLVVMDADLSKSTMTAEFGKAYPERFFNMGIAEQNLYGTACGLALAGKVVCASTFAMFAAGRAFEIIRNSIGYTHANVKICATHAGITVGEDGASHQTFEDLALMRTIPGMTVLNPSDGVSAAALIKQAVAFDGPAYIRLGRAAVPTFYTEEMAAKLEIGKAVCLRSGDKADGNAADATVIATGIMGSMLAPTLIRLFKVKSPIAAGVAIGTCSHAVGTSKAMQIGEMEGAMSGIAIGVSGLLTMVIALVYHSLAG